MASSFSSFTVTVLSSSILIESIFRIKGLGALQLEALRAGDENLIMGAILALSLLMLLGKLLSDVLSAALEPKRGF